MERLKEESIWGIASIIVFVVGVLLWVSALLDITPDVRFLTFFINPIGFVFGIVGIIRKNRYSVFGTVGNIFMTLSMFLMMTIGYLIAYIEQMVQ